MTTPFGYVLIKYSNKRSYYIPHLPGYRGYHNRDPVRIPDKEVWPGISNQDIWPGISNQDIWPGEVVQFIYETFLSVKKISEVTRQLNRRLIPTPMQVYLKQIDYPKPWYEATVKRILANPFYMGEPNHPPLITPEVYNKTQRVLLQIGKIHLRRKSI